MSGVALFFNALTQGFITFSAGLAGLRYFANIVGFGGLGTMFRGGSGETSVDRVKFK
jgi:hypothetical protein